VGHLDDGVLRRLYDEPAALPQDRAHLVACAECKVRFAAIQADARHAASLFAVTPARPPNATAALARVRAQLSSEVVRTETARKSIDQPFRRVPMYVAAQRRRLTSPLGAFALAAAVVAGVAFSPAASLANGFLTIFEPKEIVALPVTTSELQSLPNLSAYGTMSGGHGSRALQASSAAQAATLAGTTLHVPGWLPSGVPSTIFYQVMPASTATFTFSAAKVRASAAATGRALPPMPPSLDGSSIRATVGPVVITTYGSALLQNDSRRRREVIPSLVVLQAPAPSVASTGASVQQILDYLLAQPGISPALVTEIKAIGDPTSTLPIPIPIDLATAQSVHINGASGLAIGDNTRVGSGVVWEQDGMVYGVAGGMPESDILAIARSLH
jgi:hypothetical protein